MREIYLIGTIHGQTPHDELQAFVEDIGPDQLLVEMPDEPVEELKKREVYPDEMVFVWKWAKKHDIARASFEVEKDHDLFKEGVDEDHLKYKEFLEEEKKIIENHSWKEWNKNEVNQKLDQHFDPEVFDLEAMERRENEMVESIKSIMADEGKIVIITGASHLEHFREHLPGGKIPLHDR